MMHRSVCKVEDLVKLVTGTDLFLLDCDGVLYSGKNLFEGTVETIDFLRRAGKTVVFVTNNSTKNRETYARSLRKIGIENCNPEDVYCSSFAVVEHLRRINFPKDKKVLVCGSKGLLSELKSFGYDAFPTKDDITFEGFQNYKIDPEIGAVVAGFKDNFNYSCIAEAALHLQYKPECLFIASNRDVTYPTPRYNLPGAGTLIAAIEAASMRVPDAVVGKPSALLLDLVQDRFHVALDRMCMVGDRMDSDMLFGQNGGTGTLLVLTGVTDLEHVGPNGKYPDISPVLITNAFADILKTRDQVLKN